MPYLDDVLTPYQSLTGDLTAVDTLSATLTNEGELTGYIAISDVAPVLLALNDLTDVEITEPENNEVLTYDSELGKWVNGAGGSGSSDYTDLTNKPQINSITLVGNLSSSDLGLFSGDYDDLTNKPTIPDELTDLSDTNITSPSDGQILKYDGNTSKWVNGTGGGGSSDYTDLTNKPQINSVTLTGNLSTSDLGLFSGDYNDLTNKPTIPAAQVNADWDAVSGVAAILNKPSLATVATSGSYADLTNKPTIPDELTDLSDTNITSPSDGQILKYDGNTSKWVNGTGGGGASSLADLTDTQILTPQIGDMLFYDGSKWYNNRSIVNYSGNAHVVGKWVDGITDVYEVTVVLPSTVSCTAGNTSAAGTWTHLYDWYNSITIIDFKAYTNSGNDPTYWGHLSAQWNHTNHDIRVLNIRSNVAAVDGFTMRYFENV